MVVERVNGMKVTYKRVIKRILTISLAMALFIVSANVLRYMLIDDTKSYTRIMLHQLYNSADNIDVLFLGSSHVYRSIVPQIIDGGLGVHSFNAGSSAQKMDASYFLLKEAAKTNKIDTVYLELYYGVAKNEKKTERTKMTSTYIISDYAKMSKDKIAFLMHATSKDNMANSFILARRNWNKLFEPTYIFKLIKEKSSSNYRNFIWTRVAGDEEYYVDRGFVANDGMTKGISEWPDTVYDPIEIAGLRDEDNDWRKDIEAIVDFCNENDISLCFYIAPIPHDTIVAKGNYQEYHDLIEEIAKNNGVEFVDFCFIRPEYFDTTDMSLYKDEGHLNTQGAEKFSELFCDVMQGRYSKDEVLFSTVKDNDVK